MITPFAAEIRKVTSPQGREDLLRKKEEFLRWYDRSVPDWMQFDKLQDKVKSTNLSEPIQKLASEVGHVVVETAKALGITEDEIFLAPMLAEFRAKLDFKRSLLWEGTMAEFYAAGATEEQTGYWSADFYKALTARYGLTHEQAVYFSTHEEADLKEHDGVMGHGSFRRLVLRTLLEDGMAQARPGYTLEYCGLTAVDLHGVCLQAALDAGKHSAGK